MKLKLPAVIFIVLGCASCAFGAREIGKQYLFAQEAEEVSGFIESIEKIRGSRDRSPDIMVSYMYNETMQTDRLHMQIFSNTLGIRENKPVLLRIHPDGGEDPQLARNSIDVWLYYAMGIFFVLLGLMFAMFGVVIQKFGKE